MSGQRYDSASELLRRFDEWRSRHPKLSGLSLDDWWAERVELGLVAHGDSSYTQAGWRIRDDSAGLNTDSGWLADENTAVSALSTEKVFRIRFEVEETSNNANNNAFKVQYRKNAGTWTDLPDDNSYPATSGTDRAVVAIVNSNQYADGDLCSTSLLTNSVRTFDGTGEGSEDLTTGTNNFAFAVTEWEWTFIIPRYYGTNGLSENVAGDDFEFRMVQSDGTVFTSYVNGLPTVTVSNANNQFGGTYVESPAALPVIENGSAWYWLIEGDEFNARPVMMKSTDSGVTWNDVDISNGPVSGADMEGACWFKNGTDIIIYTQPDAVYRHVFSMSSDTWTTTDESVEAATGAAEQYVSAQRRSDGTEVCFFADADSVQRVAYNIRSAAGSWGTKQLIATSSSLYGCNTVLDPDTDDVYVAYTRDIGGSTLTLYLDVIDGTTDNHSGVDTVDTGLSNSNADLIPFCNMVTYDDGGVRVVSIVWNDADATTLYSKTIRDGTPQTAQTIASSVTLDTNSLASRQASLDQAVSGKKRHVVFLDTSGNEYYYTSDDEGTWASQTAPTLTAGASVPKFLRISFVNTVDLAIVYDAGDVTGSHGQIWYDEITGVGEAAGVTGSAAFTDATDTIAASGAVAIDGPGAFTDAADAVAGTGAVAIAGSGAFTDAADTIAASGSTALFGSAAFTDADDTVAGAGAVAITGTGVFTDADDTVAGTGAVTVQGSAAFTDATDAVAASGAVVVAGSASFTDADDTIAATGSGLGTITGSAAFTDADDTVAASGAVAVAGSSALIDADDPVAASGAVTISGTAAFTDSNDTIAGSGAVAVQGSAAFTDADDTIAATGSSTGAITGSGAFTDADDTVAGTGAVVVQGTGAFTDAADTIAASGAVAIAGSGAFTDAADTIAATGNATSTVTGSAAFTDAADTVAAAGAVVVAGSASFNDDPDSLAVVGGVTVSASGAFTDADDTIAVVGGVLVTGVGSFTDDADTIYAFTAGPSGSYQSGGIAVGGQVGRQTGTSQTGGLAVSGNR